jgi:plasmid stabilization system protein ParE
MARLRVSAQASADLKAIAAWIKKDNVSAARRVGDKLRQTCRFLAANPYAVEARDDLRPGLRVFTPGSPARHYAIFYRCFADQSLIEIMTTGDGSRDWQSVFGTDWG